MANWFESRAETMTETEAKAYFSESSYPHPGRVRPGVRRSSAPIWPMLPAPQR